MSTMNASEIISVLKSEIEDFDRKSGVQETGTVVRVGDGIATVFGMQHAMYGELVFGALSRTWRQRPLASFCWAATMALQKGLLLYVPASVPASA